MYLGPCTHSNLSEVIEASPYGLRGGGAALDMAWEVRRVAGEFVGELVNAASQLFEGEFIAALAKNLHDERTQRHHLFLAHASGGDRRCPDPDPARHERRARDRTGSSCG